MVCFFNLNFVILAIIHKEGLAKFGYRSKRKVENNKNCAIFWWLATTYCLNMVISEFFFPFKSCNFGAFFFSHKNPLYESDWICFCHLVGKFTPKKKCWLRTQLNLYKNL
jgi:hypothetical protein